MENRRIEKSFSECAALLSQFYLESKLDVKQQKNNAKEEVFAEVIEMVREKQKQISSVRIKELQQFIQIKLSDLTEELACLDKDAQNSIINN